MPNPDLQKIASEIRKDLVVMHCETRTSHIGSAFSCLETLITLYFKILNLYPGEPNHPQRDRFILSKGHAVSALYAVLAYRGLIPKDWLQKWHRDGSHLAGHPDRTQVPFIELSTGSLGHGLPVGVGMAYALKLNKKSPRVFVQMSDGEIQEGSVWEAANNASRLGLDNLIAIVDANKLQGFSRTNTIMPIESFPSKWKAFGWSVKEVDGHSFEALINAFDQTAFEQGKPSVIIAHTTKGKGLADLEDKLECHYRSPRPEQVSQYLKEIDEKAIY